MDAAARAELEALRERAYGPSPDIAEDGAALDRLVALEELALPAPRIDRALGTPAEPPDAGSTARVARHSVDPMRDDSPQDARVVAVLPALDPAPRSRRRLRTGWHVALVAAVALVAVPLGVTAAQQALARTTPPAAETPESVRSALSFARDPDAEVLITVRIDGSFGDYVDIPSAGDVPVFPVEGLMTWVEPLGDYYGWRVWIGGARGAIEDENCLLLDGDGTMIADCTTIDLKSQGALLLTIAFADIPPEERPEGMTADQSLGFWWSTDGVMRILLGPTPAD